MSQDSYSRQREERVRVAPRLPEMTAEEWRELFSDLEPATADDVPWRFPVRTALKRSRRRG